VESFPPTIMTPLESALYGLACLTAAFGLFAWAYVAQGRWQRGEGPQRVPHSFRTPPTAPGQKRIVLGLMLVVVGMTLVAPFVTSF
jgi:hypothetical protein